MHRSNTFARKDLNRRAFSGTNVLFLLNCDKKLFIPPGFWYTEKEFG